MESLPQELCDIVESYKKEFEDVENRLVGYLYRFRFICDGWHQQKEIFMNMFVHFMDLIEQGVGTHTLFFLDHDQIPDHDMYWASDKLRPYYYFYRKDDILGYSDEISDLLAEIAGDLKSITIPDMKEWKKLQRWVYNFQQLGYLEVPSTPFEPLEIPPED